MPEDGIINCNVCGADRWKILWEQDPYRVVRCSSCGLICQNPVVLENRATDIFGEEYFTNNYLRYEEERVAYYRTQMKNIEKSVGRRGRLLDVGCGVGFFLRVAKEAGYEVCGVEPSSFAAHYAAKFGGLDVKNSNLYENLFPEEHFDLITFWDVLAYVPDPINSLRLTQSLLKKGGTLLIKTQLWNLRTYRVASLLERVMDTRGFLHVPYALYFFNRRSLARILDEVGFKITFLEYVKEVHKKDDPPRGFKQRITRLARKFLNALNGHESMIAIAVK